MRWVGVPSPQLVPVGRLPPWNRRMVIMGRNVPTVPGPSGGDLVSSVSRDGVTPRRQLTIRGPWSFSPPSLSPESSPVRSYSRLKTTIHLLNFRTHGPFGYRLHDRPYTRRRHKKRDNYGVSTIRVVNPRRKAL